MADEKKDMQDTGVTKVISGVTSDITDDSGTKNSTDGRVASNHSVTNDVEMSRLANHIVNKPKLHGNAFACLAQSEDEEKAKSIVETYDFSDSSPILDTFKQIKRVDELDFTPVP